MSFAKTKRGKGWCALYARYSTGKQDPASIDVQLRVCREDAARRGLKVYREYSDGAKSGRHIDREALKCLQADAAAGHFEEVIIYNDTKLSRNLGNTEDVVFGELKFHGVRVYDVAKRVASDDPHGRLMFQVGGIVNEQFIAAVSRDTHFHLKNRAEQGFATGGPKYGYTSGPPQVDPNDPKRIRHPIVIRDDQAEVVRRIFKLWVEGMALKKISHQLNADGVLAPRDASSGGVKQGKGWGHTTVRSILTAERYIGRFVWNKSEFVQHPKREHRARRMRDPNEWVTAEKPELSIIDGETWRAAQARFRRVEREGPGRTWGTGKRDGWLLSGLCRCAECGAGIAIFSRKKKGTKEFARVRCTGASSRGNCNARCVAETRLVRALVDNLQQQLTDPTLADAFVTGFLQEYRELKRQHEAAGGSMADALRAAERKVNQAGNLLAQHHEQTGTWSAALGERLATAEAELAAVRKAAAAAQTDARAEVPTLPTVPQLRAAFTKLASILSADKVQARAALGAHLIDKLAIDTRGTTTRLTGTLDLARGAVKFVAGARFELATFGL